MSRLDELRIKWKTATSDERRIIEEEARLIKGDTIYQCYFVDKNGVQCQNRQQDCWCSDEHRIAWQESNYLDKRQRGEHRLSIQEMRKRLRAMGGKYE